MIPMNKANDLIRRSSQASVGGFISNIAISHPNRIAIVDESRKINYQELDNRTNQFARLLLSHGLETGDRVAILAKNCQEYLEAEVAAAKSGLILACLNWRLGNRELKHCISLVEPKLIIAQSSFKGALADIGFSDTPTIFIGTDLDKHLSQFEASSLALDIDPETGLLILYTSGTTGLPKGALISQRAMMARSMATSSQFEIPPMDNFIAWPPMYHMAATDQALSTLMRGGSVYVVDGYQPARIIKLVKELPTRHLILMPGMVGDFAQRIVKSGVTPKGIGLCGAMADLVPKAEIAAATKALNAPFANTFGATETGLVPATGNSIPIGVMPETLSKEQSLFCELRLVDANDEDVPVGVPGELAVRGPTLFSGYWNNDAANLEDFRGGWFHMGDVLRRNADGTLDYVDRVKYMIKSGGENIYPAEIEMVLQSHPHVAEAIVVKKPDEKWSEVPVAFIVRSDDSLNKAALMDLCKKDLSGYKRPKEIHFIDAQSLPRSTTGKVQRHVLEERLFECG